MGQKSQADAQSAANVEADNSARVQAISDYDQLTRAGLQEKAAGTQKISENQIAAKRAAASTSASASEAGISGLSVNSLLTDIYGQEARLRDGVNQNIEGSQQQMKTELENTNRSLRNTIATRAPVNKPSFGGAVLEGATGIFGAYKDDLRIKSKLK
jgi:hypothetical protein